MDSYKLENTLVIYLQAGFIFVNDEVKPNSKQPETYFSKTY